MHRVLQRHAKTCCKEVGNSRGKSCCKDVWNSRVPKTLLAFGFVGSTSIRFLGLCGGLHLLEEGQEGEQLLLLLLQVVGRFFRGFSRGVVREIVLRR